MVIWIVNAWKDVPEKLIEKSWKICGYKTEEELAAEEKNGVEGTTSILDFVDNKDKILKELD